MEVRRLLVTNGDDPYPCFKCNEGRVYRETRQMETIVPEVTEEEVVGACRQCGEVNLRHMESADGLLSFQFLRSEPWWDYSNRDSDGSSSV